VYSEIEDNHTNGAPSSNLAPRSIFAGASYIDASHSTFNAAGGNITYANYTSDFKKVLSTLKPVDCSGYYVQPCMEGTREILLQEIDVWLEDPKAPNVLWIKGYPGSGKSTIASSIISRLIKCGRMGSSFAFKQEDMMLSDPAAVWRTMAHDLARYDASFASILVGVLKSGRVDPGRADITAHFESLIMETLMKRHEHSSPSDIPVLIIDALDECGSHSSQSSQRKALLDTLICWSHMPGTFKLIITGRNERMPRLLFSSCRQIELLVGAEASEDTNEDIRLFFERRFAGTGSCFLPDWPTGRVVDILTARAAGLFIWAETVVRFVEQGLPEERLEHVLDGDLGQVDNVTQLYRQILELLFPEASDRTLLNVLNQVMTAIIFAKIPLHVDDLPRFILQPQSSVNFILHKLSSVISVGHDTRIRVNHLSFVEFMCDARRCPPQFYIDPNKGSQSMSTACFRLMKDGLKFNICDLETSHLPNKCVDDLSERIMKNVHPPLLYSCRFWAAHIGDVPNDQEQSATLLALIKDFILLRFLYWLEIMSVTEDVAAANITLLAAAGWVQVSVLSNRVRSHAEYYTSRLVMWSCRIFFAMLVNSSSISSPQFRKVPHTSTYQPYLLRQQTARLRSIIDHSSRTRCQ
jgi:hypothetical protein